MRIFYDIDSLPAFRAPVVTVGSFDGVHRGHLHLLAELRARAAMVGGSAAGDGTVDAVAETVVVTFARHPRELLEPGGAPMQLTSVAEKEALIARAGIDNLVVMPFDERIAAMTAEEFVRDVLVGRLGVAELVVGYNHRLGRDRQGDIEALRELGSRYGFRVHRAARLTDGAGGGNVHESGSIEGETSDSGVGGGAEGKISSTAIRRAIERGDVEAAERMLGRKI
ncbi:MAG: FAD synthetase [Alistipes sp.]|jgi:FAD synthase|nr:FAD synthetase [Alistipes sp.]